MSISGISARTFSHLPPEEQQMLRAQEKRNQQPAAPAATQPAPSQPKMLPSQAKTPREAVQAIHAMPLPYTGDLAGLPSNVLDAVFDPRARQFNAQRVAAAQEARDSMAPKREDFGGLNSRTSSDEYGQARDAYNNDPYVQELNRIIAEGTARPTEVPKYLTTTTTASPAKNVPVGEMRNILAHIGVNIPENATPEQILAGYEILGTIPDSILGPVISPGTQVTFEKSLYGVGTPQFIPARVGGDVSVQGQVALSDVATGAGFQQSQTFEMTTQVQTNTSFDFGKTPLNKLYSKANTLDKVNAKGNDWGLWQNNLQLVSPGAKNLIESSPLKYVVKGLPVPSFNVSTYSGERLKFEATVTPEQGSRLAAGDLAAAPNPLDPLNMPEGTSVMIRGQHLEGTAFGASWKNITVGGSVTELEGTGFGVRKLQNDVVEVFSGPVQTVENSAFAGLGKGTSLSVGVSVDTSVETQQMSVARIDLRTVEGQMAYQQFMSTGQIPLWDPPGVQASGKAEVFTGDKAVRLGANVGSVSVAFGNKSQLNVTRTQWDDGTITQTNTYAPQLNHTSEVTAEIGPDGKAIDSRTSWTLVMADYDPTVTSYLSDAFSKSATPHSYGTFDGPQHVQLKFTADDLMGVRAQARATLPGGQDRLAVLDRDPSQASSPQEVLASAKTPGDVFHFLNTTDSHNVAVTLATIRGQSHQQMPGSLSIKDAG